MILIVFEVCGGVMHFLFLRIIENYWFSQVSRKWGRVGCFPHTPESLKTLSFQWFSKGSGTAAAIPQNNLTLIWKLWIVIVVDVGGRCWVLPPTTTNNHKNLVVSIVFEVGGVGGCPWNHPPAPSKTWKTMKFCKIFLRRGSTGPRAMSSKCMKFMCFSWCWGWGKHPPPFENFENLCVFNESRWGEGSTWPPGPFEGHENL